MNLELLLNGNVITLILVLLMLTLLWLDLRRPSGMPPGPAIVVPILGNLVNISSQNMLEQLRDYRSKYGNIFSLKMGNKWWIILNGYETLHEAFVKNADIFSSRPGILFNRGKVKGQGILASSGPLWKEHRTFALNKLRKFGFGKRSLETNILEEVKELIETMENQKGHPFDIMDVLHTCVSNVICSIAFGKRFHHTDPVFLRMIGMFNENVRLNSAAAIGRWLPFVKYIPFDISGRRKLAKNDQEIENFIGKIIEEHCKTFDENNIRDYIDCFISEKKRKENDQHSTFTDIQLKRTIFELFGAGTETTTTTIRWAIIYLMRNPDIQDKMRQEIEKVAGTSQFPRMHHRQDMPFTEAVITEIQRCGNIVPLSVFHGVDKEMIFKGFKIPKDAVISPNLDSVLYDEKEFLDSFTFKPSRFISEDGKFCGQEKVIPFSIGRRVCLGESLARMELFLFLTSMVQRFKFVPENDKSMPTLEAKIGATRSPNPFKFCPVLVD